MTLPAETIIVTDPSDGKKYKLISDTDVVEMIDGGGDSPPGG